MRTRILYKSVRFDIELVEETRNDNENPRFGEHNQSNPILYGSVAWWHFIGPNWVVFKSVYVKVLVGGHIMSLGPQRKCYTTVLSLTLPCRLKTSWNVIVRLEHGSYTDTMKTGIEWPIPIGIPGKLMFFRSLTSPVYLRNRPYWQRRCKKVLGG